ncbi:MAG: hypothetical protein ACTSU9_14900 [Promethearchaeota archaeon]
MIYKFDFLPNGCCPFCGAVVKEVYPSSGPNEASWQPRVVSSLQASMRWRGNVPSCARLVLSCREPTFCRTLGRHA